MRHAYRRGFPVQCALPAWERGRRTVDRPGHAVSNSVRCERDIRYSHQSEVRGPVTVWDDLADVGSIVPGRMLTFRT